MSELRIFYKDSEKIKIAKNIDILQDIDKRGNDMLYDIRKAILEDRPWRKKHS